MPEVEGNNSADDVSLKHHDSQLPSIVDEEVALDGNASRAVESSQSQTYKRRWIGLLQLTLLNFVVSFDGSNIFAIADLAAGFFSTNLSAINFLSTAFLIGFVIMSPISLYALRSGPKFAMLVASAFILLGSWIRYAGAKGGKFRVLSLGHVLISFAQPFILACPTRYSEMWFRGPGRVPATAATSLAPAVGTAVAQLVTPLMAKTESDIPRMALWTAALSTFICLATIFIPARPPTPLTSRIDDRPSVLKSLTLLGRNGPFWISFVILIVLLGLFNAFSSLLSQTLLPYQFHDKQAGIGGALLVGAGLLASAILSPFIGRYHKHTITIRVLVPLVSLSFTGYYFAPPTAKTVAVYVSLSFLGATAFLLLPVVLEHIADISKPVSPEVSSVLSWTSASVLGAIFVVIMNGLREGGNEKNATGNMQKSLIFQAVIAWSVVPLLFFLKGVPTLQIRRKK